MSMIGAWLVFVWGMVGKWLGFAWVCWFMVWLWYGSGVFRVCLGFV
jgi:hypothetical protein